MRSGTITVTILLLLAWVAVQLQITPLEAGTIVIEDKLIRLNTCISKSVVLKLRKEYFQSHSNIEAIAVMSGLKMNDELAFQFYHKIVCVQLNCQFHLSLERFTPIVSPFFSYSITIDFLIAHGLKTKNFNMTYSRQNFKIPNFQEESKISKIENQVQKNEQWIVLPLIYGFSDMKLTGFVQVSQVQHSDNLVVKYVDKKEDTGNQPKRWANNEKFVLYKMLFLPKSYFQDYKNAKKLFIGLKSLKNKEIQYEFYSNQQSKAIIKEETQQKGLQVLNIPFNEAVIFNDDRKHPFFDQITVQSKKQHQSNYSLRMIYGAVFLLMLEFAYVFYKRNLKKQTGTQQLKKIGTLPEMVISFQQYSANNIDQQTKCVHVTNQTVKSMIITNKES